MTSLILGCIFVSLIIQIQGYNFGFNNGYTCHCLNNEKCDTVTGGCNNGCLRGWGGPSCQQENVALDSTFVNQSGIFFTNATLYGPQLVVDGYNSTDKKTHNCSDTGYSPWAWWSIDLLQQYTIGYLKIFHIDGDLYLKEFKGFSVEINSELCFKHTGTSNPPAVYPIECSRTITGRYVNISNNKPGDTQNYFALCEVEIYVCSEGTYGSDCNNFCHCSNYDKCDVITGQCPNGCQMGWYGDNCNTSCSTINKYGVGCQKRCDDRQCSGNSTCDHVTGECVDGCRSGYNGIDCSQDCSTINKYGVGCQKRCDERQCSGNSTCDHVNGECVNGCKTGYKGIDCSQDCSTVNKYGVGCQKRCDERQCSGDSTCDHVTGECVNGCGPGYKGIDCSQGYNFGFNNGYTCHCLDNQRCDTVTGGCNNGCLRGWGGPSCQQENIALDSTFVNQSGTNENKATQYGPQLVIDGYNSTNRNTHYCSDTGYSPWAWWSIDLLQQYTIGYLKIFYRYDRLKYFKGFEVHIDDELCFKHTGTSNPPAELPIKCTRSITGRYVNISNNRPGDTTHFFALCEVEIYVCSEGTYGSDCNNFCHCSNYDKCDVISGQCPNGCQIGWHGNNCNTSCSTINKYGVGCQKRCDERQCSGDSPCNDITGECVNGCRTGYKGIDCSQDCSTINKYGVGCQKRCDERQCSGNSNCDRVTGACVDGCKAGYKGIDCSQGCSTINKYGVGCQKRCDDRQCSGISSCDHATGKCIYGCEPGYKGIDCSQDLYASLERENMMLVNERTKEETKRLKEETKRLKEETKRLNEETKRLKEETKKLQLEQAQLNLENEILMLRREQMTNRTISTEM